MTAFGWIISPDRRLLGRLVQLLRTREGKGAFTTAGEALANSLLASRPMPLSVEAEQLADAMVGSLLLVNAATADAEEPDRRVRLAVATIAMAVARPHTAAAAYHAVTTWVGTGIGCPRRQDNPYALACRVLLALWLDDNDTAANAIDTLVERDHTGVAGVLHDWVVARIQGHGADREAQCFDHLRLSLSQTPGGGDGAGLLLLAAAVVVDRMDRPLREVRSWLDGIACEPIHLVEAQRHASVH